MGYFYALRSMVYHHCVFSLNEKDWVLLTTEPSPSINLNRSTLRGQLIRYSLFILTRYQVIKPILHACSLQNYLLRNLMG